MTLTYRIFAGIFGIISTVLFKYGHNNTALLFVVLSLISLVSALVSNGKPMKNKEGEPEMTSGKTFIGKKVTVSIGGKPPKPNPNEIVGESTTVHIPSEDIGKYDSIVGVESTITVGGDDDK